MLVVKKVAQSQKNPVLTRIQIWQWSAQLGTSFLLLIISIGWDWNQLPILKSFYATLIVVISWLISKLCLFRFLNKTHLQLSLAKKQLTTLAMIRWRLVFYYFITNFLAILGLLIALITNLIVQKMIFNLIFSVLTTVLLTMVNFLAIIIGGYFQK